MSGPDLALLALIVTLHALLIWIAIQLVDCWLESRREK